jgi:hypothetical protein
MRQNVSEAGSASIIRQNASEAPTQLGAPDRASPDFWVKRNQEPNRMGLAAFSGPGGAVGRGTAALQAGRSRIQFPMGSMNFELT